MAQTYLGSIEEAVKAANNSKIATLVFYDYHSNRTGTIERGGGYTLKGCTTFYNCTVDEVRRHIKWHIDNPDQERGVNYS